VSWRSRGQRHKKCNPVSGILQTRKFLGLSQQQAICLFLALATLIAFAQTLGHGFSGYDDDVYITNNRYVKHGMTIEGVRWAFCTSEACFWHPLVWLSYMIDTELFRGYPFGYHLTNLLLHIANTLVLFAFLNRATGALWKSAFVAALFALHPLHVESVAWAAQRKDTLSTLFWMLTMWMYVRYGQCSVDRGKPVSSLYFGVLGLFTLGLMAKPMLVTLPFVLLLMDFWPLGRMKPMVSDTNPEETSAPQSNGFRTGIRSSIGKLVLEKIPMLVLSVVFSVIAYWAQSRGGALGTLSDYTVGVRLANIPVSYMTYIVKMLWPRNLAVFYPHPGDRLPTWEVLFSVILLVGFTIIVAKLMRRCPYMMVGWLWFLGTLIPVIGIVQVGGHAVADRYTYVPLIGLFMAIAWGIPDLFSRSHCGREVQNTGLAVAGILSIIALGICTYVQVGYWDTSIKLFRRAIAVTHRNHVAHNNLGVVYKWSNKPDLAILHFKRALEIWPGYPDAQLNLGTTLLAKGQIDEAMNVYRRAIKSSPREPMLYYNYAVALTQLGRINEAIEQYEKAIKLRPDYVSAQMNMGILLGKIGRHSEAIAHLKAAVNAQPDYGRAHYNLAAELYAVGDYAGARKELDLAMKCGLKVPAWIRESLEYIVPME